MNVDQAALMETDNLRHAHVNSALAERTVRLKLAERPDRDGLEIALKGGQVGDPDFFLAAKRGGA